MHDVLSCGCYGVIRCGAMGYDVQGQGKGQRNRRRPGLRARREQARARALVGALVRAGVVRA